ncbi:MAG: hypothetical protein R3B49_06630 [Phycisphaerales bacterium]
MPAETERQARVDAHVHLHRRFDVARVLDAAVRHAGPRVALCLTECAGVDRFAELRAAGRAGAWTITPTDEPESIVATRAHDSITLLAGRQIITAERIEVLALSTPTEFNDGRGLDETIDAVLGERDRRSPWGFGKWWGEARATRRAGRAARTRSAACALATTPGAEPRARTPHFKLARDLGVPCLPGTDPLDLDHHDTRAGSYGFTLASPLDARRARTCAACAAMNTSPPAVGSATLGAFVRDQAMLRLANRKAGAA